MAEKLNFEKSMQHLEEIAQELEQGELSLDEAMELYAQAAKLILSCQKKLDTAHLKFEKIKTQSFASDDKEGVEEDV